MMTLFLSVPSSFPKCNILLPKMQHPLQCRPAHKAAQAAPQLGTCNPLESPLLHKFHTAMLTSAGTQDQYMYAYAKRTPLPPCSLFLYFATETRPCSAVPRMRLPRLLVR